MQKTENHQEPQGKGLSKKIRNALEKGRNRRKKNLQELKGKKKAL